MSSCDAALAPAGSLPAACWERGRNSRVHERDAMMGWQQTCGAICDDLEADGRRGGSSPRVPPTVAAPTFFRRRHTSKSAIRGRGTTRMLFGPSISKPATATLPY